MPSGSVCAIAASLLQRLAEVEPVPALLHDDAEHDGGLALVADQEGRRILVAAANLGDVGELQRAPAATIGVSAIFWTIVIGAVETDEDLRPAWCRSSPPA